MNRQIQSRRHNNAELPLEIILTIIERLPLKLIIGCKSLSKPLNHLISDHYLSHISNSLYTIFINRSDLHISLDLLQFHQTNETTKVATFNTDRHIGSCYSIHGYCNGLFCILKFRHRRYNLYLYNPILGQIVLLPNLALITDFSAYGIGYCQFTNRYKVLQIITKCVAPGRHKNNAQIFSVGSDRNWRRVSDANVPYCLNYNGHQSPMLPFRSALHWVVQTTRVPAAIKLVPKWGGSTYICAFDITKEKVTALDLPKGAFHPPQFRGPCFTGSLTVLLDKLCLWQFCGNLDVVAWVMNEYGDEDSWTKQFVIRLPRQPINGQHFPLHPLMLLPEGVMVLSDCYRLFFYDIEKKECLRFFYQSYQYSLPIPFVPCFVSLRKLFPC